MQYIYFCENSTAGGVIYGKGVYQITPELSPYVEDLIFKDKAREATPQEIAEYETKNRESAPLGDY